MRKNYILDTNILIHDPQSIFSFQDNNLYVPIYVLEELDKLKSEQSLRGRNSRESCRLIDDLRCSGHLAEGVDINKGGKFIVYVPTERMIPKVAIDLNNMDNAILQAALDIQSKTPKETKTILVTMDINLRIRADSLGVQTASYESTAVDSIHTGHENIDIELNDINSFFKNKMFDYNCDFNENTCITLKSFANQSGLGRYSKKNKQICSIKTPKEGVLGIKPKNKEQHFALDLLLDDAVKLLTLVGIAGSGKTLLSLSAGLYGLLNGFYSKFLISRPVMPMGKDIGFLPGSIDEKLDPYMKPFYDNLDYIMMAGNIKTKYKTSVQTLLDDQLIQVEPITYIRGRSLPNCFILIDEAQNLSSHEIKTIITRCGEGTKIVFTGDPDQIDNPYMDKGNCGLSVAVEKLQDNPLVGHLVLSKGERSELANLAATKM